MFLDATKAVAKINHTFENGAILILFNYKNNM
jgi:hypothetical protein